MAPELAFGTVLRKVRKEKGLSQEDLAFSSQLDRIFISRLENGHRQPTITTILRLSDALGVPAWQMVADVEKLVKGEGN